MADVDRIAPQMIDEAIPILEKNVKSKCRNIKTQGHWLIQSKKTKANKNKYGYYASVRPTGKDSKGVRNMEKLVYLEYGTSKQSPKPTLTKAINDSESSVLNKMQEVFSREVGE